MTGVQTCALPILYVHRNIFLPVSKTGFYTDMQEFYDIRTDKWEVAQDAMNSVNKQRSIEANNALKGLNEAMKKTEENNKTTPQLEAENG